MTLGRPGRGPTSRGTQHQSQVGPGWSDPVEIEELPPRPVLGRGQPGLGIRGMLVVGAMVALLAAGFGVLGGRPESSTAPSAVPQATRPGSSSAPGFTGAPQVTPASACAATPPAAGPEILLQVNGRPTPGQVEVLGPSGWAPASTPIQVTASSRSPDIPVQIRSDVVSELWIVGGACAHAWTIVLADLQDTYVIGAQDNPSLDPAFASQNRFALVLAPYRGRDFDLKAELTFSNLVVRAGWPIRVLSFEAPSPRLTASPGPVRLVRGCDVTLTLGNGWEEGRPCSEDLAADPEPAVDVGPGERLSFRFREGWQVDGAVVVCGRLSGRSFIAEEGPICELEAMITGESMAFPAPTDSGRWILAISACGGQYLVDSSNRLCGTWYANVRVRG